LWSCRNADSAMKWNDVRILIHVRSPGDSLMFFHCQVNSATWRSRLELLAILNAAERLDHISPLKSVSLHPLKGNRRGQWAITVNGPWRICFRFKGGVAYEVEIVDYH
jgi:plasmid maintenance system killer protein